MNRIFLTALALAAQFCTGAEPAAKSRAAKLASTVFLDEISVKNLRLQTVMAEEQGFEETIFALGRIDVRPGFSAVVSSRIAGRVVKVDASPDHHVDKGEVLVVVESGLPGDPPPQINLTAPISGLISEIDVVLGEPVRPENHLLTIVDLSSVYGVARIPENMAARVKKGLAARIKVSGWPDEELKARIEHLGAVADHASGTIEAAFHINNPDMKLRPGMRAEFSIVTSRREGVMSIPRQALQGEPSNRFVYVEDDTVRYAFIKVPVEIGLANDRHVEIISGLFPGDKVVTEGAYSLSYAGKGTISLKEALDAAHGHEHNEDGSEKTGADSDAKSKQASGTSGTKLSSLTLFSLLTNVILAVLLVTSRLRRNIPGQTTAG